MPTLRQAAFGQPPDWVDLLDKLIAAAEAAAAERQAARATAARRRVPA